MQRHTDTDAMESKAQLQFSVHGSNFTMENESKIREKKARNRQKFGEKGISAEREVHETKARKYLRIWGKKGN